MSSGTVIIETIASDALRGNPLGDPFVRRVPVYLPPGYESGNARYPVVFVLTGFTGRGTMLLNDSAWDETLPQRTDRLIADGKVQPMILVMPDCFTRIGGSQYLNSSAVGQYEDHVVKELVAFVDKKYRTIADRDHRALVGKSSGGYGSVILAMRHPDVFGLMASHSGDMYFERAACVKEIRRAGQILGRISYGPSQGRRFQRDAQYDRDGSMLLAQFHRAARLRSAI